MILVLIAGLCVAMFQIDEAALADVFSSDAPEDVELQVMLEQALTHPLYTFEPRPDAPEDFDEQTAFVYETDAKFSVLLGGTGSGKTEAAAYKTARYVLETPPPRERCPFWVVGDTLSKVIDVCWVEKLSQYIPEGDIHSIAWHERSRNRPAAVMLRDPEDGEKVGWVLEFKSYDQGFSSMKASSIGGYWCNEEVPYEIVEEIQGRCRDYDSPGWADFTPLEVKSPEWLDHYDDPPDSWRFFHLNTRANAADPASPVSEEWAERFLAQVPEDMRDTREIGKFSVLRGQVFKEFRKSIHVVEPFRIPRDWRKTRGIDFGFNNPFCCLWVARDADDCYYVYDEHYKNQELIDHHAGKINDRDWEQDQPWYGPSYADHDPQCCAELSEYGIITTPASKAINPGIEVLRSLMMVKGNGKPQLFIFDTCTELIREILGYKWPEGTTGRNPVDVPVDKDNHAIDALRYAIYSDRIKTSDALPSGHRAERDSRRHGVLLRKGGNGRR